jgi:hypothetical protein
LNTRCAHCSLRTQPDGSAELAMRLQHLSDVGLGRRQEALLRFRRYGQALAHDVKDVEAFMIPLHPGLEQAKTEVQQCEHEDDAWEPALPLGIFDVLRDNNWTKFTRSSDQVAH